jgi:hypothetical protein
MADPASWDEARRVADENVKTRQAAWVAWGVDRVDQGADAAAVLAAAKALLDAAAAAAKAAEAAAGLATTAAEGGGDAAVTAKKQADIAETQKIEAWKNAAQAIALANEVNPPEVE